MRSTSNSNTLCITETLNNLQPYTGDLTITNLESYVSAIMSGGSIPNIPSNVTCTDCVKASYSIVSQSFGDLIPSSVSSDLSSTCGSSFVGESTPLCEHRATPGLRLTIDLFSFDICRWRTALDRDAAREQQRLFHHRDT